MNAEQPAHSECGAINPEQTHRCDLPAGHAGEHEGAELPTFTLDEPWEVGAPEVEVRAALSRLDGSDAAAVSLATGLSAAELDDLGGMPTTGQDGVA